MFTEASFIIPLGGVYRRVAMNLVTVLTSLSFQGARFNLVNSMDMNSQPMASVSRHGVVEGSKDFSSASCYCDCWSYTFKWAFFELDS